MARSLLHLHIDGQLSGHLLRRAEIRMQDDHHTLAILSVDYGSSARAAQRFQPSRERAPVRLQYGVLPNMRTFYGYVHHHEIASESGVSKSLVVEYVLVGTSLVLDHERSRSWQSVTASYVARQIAREAGLQAVVHRSDDVLAYLPQNGISDFKLLRKLAADRGFRLWIDGATLSFLDPRVLLIGPSNRELQIFTQYSTRNKPTNVHSMSVAQGQVMPDGAQVANRRIHGFDPRTRRAFQLTSHDNPNAFLDIVQTGAAVESVAEAQTLLNNLQLKNRNYLTAKASVVGTARVRPGSVVHFDGDALASTARGRWYVSKAVHRLNPLMTAHNIERFTTDLELMRDTVTTPTFVDVRELPPHWESMPAVLNRRNQWQAEVVSEHIDG